MGLRNLNIPGLLHCNIGEIEAGELGCSKSDIYGNDKTMKGGRENFSRKCEFNSQKLQEHMTAPSY